MFLSKIVRSNNLLAKIVENLAKRQLNLMVKRDLTARASVAERNSEVKHLKEILRSLRYYDSAFDRRR